MVNTNFSSFFQESAIQRVFIYTGNATRDGVYYDGVEKIKALFRELKCPWEIIEVTQEEFHPEQFVPKEALFIVPGARASDLDDQIGGKISGIREFVEDGGYYLGICGGAYWASKNVSYQLSRTETLEKIRDLAFFNGIVKGPLRFSKFGNDRPHGVANVKWRTLSFPFPALIMGGGSFIDAEQSEQCEVLAEYADVPEKLKNAIIKNYVGKGISILAGPHLEWQAQDVRVSDLELLFPGHKWTEIKNELEGTDTVRRHCFGALLAEFERRPNR
ncbi:MAG: BPL-N domain-containing protein [Waddliaceae bacterium]